MKYLTLKKIYSFPFCELDLYSIGLNTIQNDFFGKTLLIIYEEVNFKKNRPRVN